MLSNLRAIFKLILTFIVIISLLCFSTLFLYPLYKIDPYRFRPYLSKFIQLIIRVISIIWGLKVNVKNIKLIPQNENFLFVSNHLSYLDIFIISKFLNLSYITSFEMKEDTILGPLVELAGCVFVERRKEKRSTEGRELELIDIKRSLQNKINIGLFPEATSTNGEEIIPFKKGMYYPAFELKKNILVACLNYRLINDTPLSLKNRDKVCWYGEMNFFTHFWDFLKLKKVEVDLEFVDYINSSNFKSVGELVNATKKAVVDSYRPIQ